MAAGRKPKEIRTAKFSHREGRVELTEIDRHIVADFLQTGEKKATLEKYYGKGNFKNYEIYDYFNRGDIKNLIFEMGKALSVHLPQLDEKLIAIINSNRSANRDKIAAIKLFNEIYKRVESQKVELNLGVLSDEQLENMVLKIIDDGNKESDNSGVLQT